MKKFLIALAFMSFAVTTVQAHGGRWHGHGHGHHRAGPFLFFGALAALSIPLLYAQRTQPGPVYSYDGAPPSRIYVPTTQPGYSVAGAPSAASSDVIELGPVESLPPMEMGRPTESERRAGSVQYPLITARHGQTPQQLAQDRYDCSRWATHESGYDPELRKHRNPETGPEAYGRAMGACLERRGYAVR